MGASQHTAPDGDDAPHFLPGSKLILNLVHQLRHFLSPSSQHHPRVRQCEVLSPHKERGAQLLLQLGHLAAQRRLRDVEGLRCL